LAKTYQNEPDGFREIKWGTDIAKLKDMEFKRVDPSYGGCTVYTKKDDKLKIGNADLKTIEYSLWKDQFNSVLISTKGYTNWSNLKEACFEKFGKGYKPNRFLEEYSWFGDTTSMSLEYNEFSEKGILYMYSEKIGKQQDEYDKQKAKEGAKKDF
jgi:hypothetical protein